MNSFETIRPYIFVALFIGFALLETIFPERKRSFSKRNWTNVILFSSGKFDLKTLWLPKTYNRMENHSIHWSKIPVDQIFINHSYTPPKDRKYSSKLNKGF